MPGEIETAHNFPRDILRGILSPMFGGVERDDANRVAVLAGHRIADDGFEIGFPDIGFRECRAEVSVIVDDEIKRNGCRENLSTKPRRRNRSRLPPTALAMISGKRFGVGFGIGARAVYASGIAATRSMSEIRV
jgi:hypothetical protein